MKLVGHLFGNGGQSGYKLLPVEIGNKYPHNPMWDGPMTEIRGYLQNMYGKRGYKITSKQDPEHGGLEVYANI
jgi:hypothetical protein